MINATAYTPLESLFLLTWIRSHGLDAFEAKAFPRLSQDLINNDTIRQDPSYDASRLTPESLQELFLHLLQEELRDDLASHDASPPDGSLSPNSKKRKRPGPLPQVTSLQDARKHAHRLADAEAKLYAKYKQKAALDLWREQEELDRLELEITQLELQEKEAAKARNGANVGQAAPANPLKEPGRPPSAVPAIDSQKAPAPQSNGNGPHSPQPIPAQDVASRTTASLPSRASSTQPASVAVPSQPPVRPPTASPVPRQQQVSLDVSSVPARPVPSPTPNKAGEQGSSATAAAENPPKSAVTKPGSPSNASQGPQVSGPSALKWEPPYQPQPGSQQQRLPQNVAQFPPQKIPHHPQQWNTQPQTQYPYQPPLQPAPQTNAQQQMPQPPLRPNQAVPQPGTQGPALQPAPIRSHSSSPAPPIQRPLAASPPLPGQARLPHSPYQQSTQQIPPPHAVPGLARIAPNVGPTPPPPSQQWQKPPTPSQVPAAGGPQGSHPAHTQHNTQGQQAQQSSQSQLPQHVQQAQPRPSAPLVQSIPQSSSITLQQQAHRPVVPPAIGTQQVSTPGPATRRPHPVLPHTPITMPFTFRGPQGSGTKWKTAQPTPSTPGPAVGDVQSPAFEPLSPVLQTTSLPPTQPKRQAKPAEIDTSAAKKATKPAPSSQTGENSSQSNTPAPPPHGDSDQVEQESATKIKREEATPKPLEDAGDTTADESVSGRRQFVSPRNPRPINKRKRQGSAMSDQRTASEAHPRLPPPPPPGIPTHVLWTRGFPKVSASTLEQISSHKYANMFTNPIKPKEAPGYHSIILRATCLKNIQKAIHAGNKAAAAAAAAQPDGDPGTSSVWLPISEELVPPRAIINSAQLERELVHMFANAIMYNLDPNRGPGPTFLKGSGVGSKGANEAHGRSQSQTGGDAANMIGYQVDQDSVVKDTQSMFSEVDKLLIELRSTEAQPGVPPAMLPPGAVPASERLARGSFATASVTDQGQRSPAVGASFADDEADEHHTDRDEGTGGTIKRRRLARSKD